MYTDPVGSIDQEDVKGLMQVQKYKLGEANFVKTSPYENYSWTWNGVTIYASESALKQMGATPLIESENRLDEDVETISDFVCYTDGKVHPSALANTIAEIHRRINALQKGVK